MEQLDEAGIRRFLLALSGEAGDGGELLLLGGSALIMLGMPRSTLDVDYLGDDLVHDDFQRTIDRVAAELHIHVDAVPIGNFVPVPAGAAARHIPLGRFGTLEVSAFDPYTIALSKLNRGFDSDLDDIVFLITQGMVHTSTLQDIVNTALMQAREFDMDESSVRRRLEEARRRTESG